MPLLVFLSVLDMVLLIALLARLRTITRTPDEAVGLPVRARSTWNDSPPHRSWPDVKADRSTPPDPAP